MSELAHVSGPTDIYGPHCTGADAVSPETATAALTLLHIPVTTGHSRRRSEAAANLVPYTERMADMYNKSANVQCLEVGQHVGLEIPSEVREKSCSMYGHW